MKALKFTLPWLMALAVIITGSSSLMGYTVSGKVTGLDPALVPFGAVVHVYEADPVPGGSFTLDELTLSAIAMVDENGDYSVNTASPFGSGGYEAGGPDLLFVITQNISGTHQAIYEETTDQIHWNVTDGSTINFVIDSPIAILYNEGISGSGLPPGKDFIFTRVGKYTVSTIDCRASDPASQGYLNSRRTGHAATTDSDIPFGSTLDLFGQFGTDVLIDYYKVQFSDNGGSSWTDIKTSLPNEWYDRSDPYSLNWKWVPESMGPFTVGTETNLYKIPFRVDPTRTWAYLDRVVRFDTKKAGNGLVMVRVLGFVESGGVVSAATSSEVVMDVNYGQIFLQVDNTAPTVLILGLKLNGSSRPPCDILSFGATDKIRIDFKVWDQLGHLKDYTLDAMYGHDLTVSPRPVVPTSPDNATDSYANFGPTSWQGNMSYAIEYDGTIHDPSKMPSCAYQFRLHASKRTTNGYGYIYKWVEDTWHVTIQR